MADCETSTCGGRIAFGPPRGDVAGLGYCHACAHIADDEDWDDDLVDELLYEDGAT